uniref:Uncharacterized protein n=1 Tax=Panagrolaimus sp. PS1159 TaxID=55785 RepID=A0AC35GSD4_9BILA
MNNSISDTTGFDQSTSPPEQTIYSYQFHSQIRNAKYMNYDEINNNKNNLINGKIFPSAPIEFKPAPSNEKISPFLCDPPMSVTLDFLQPPPLPPAATTSSSSSVATKKKEYVPVSYIRIWTELYDVYTKIDKCVDVVVLAPHNTKFFQRLIATNTIHITYCENYPLLSNMLALLNWTNSCRFFLSARGFCEDFITFLKTLPR